MVKIVVAVLSLGLGEVDAAFVEAHGGAGFHAVGTETESHQLFGDTMRGGFGHSPTFLLHASHMHQAVQESAGSENHRLGVKGDAKGGFYACHCPTLKCESSGDILPHI